MIIKPMSTFAATLATELCRSVKVEVWDSKIR